MHSTVGTVLAYLQLAIWLVYWQVQVTVSQESNVELRKSANNSDNLQVQWDLGGFYPSVFDVCNIMQ